MVIPDAAFSAVRFCSYIPYVVRSTIGLLSEATLLVTFLLSERNLRH